MEKEIKQCQSCLAQGFTTFYSEGETCPVCFPQWANTGMPNGEAVNRMVNQTEMLNLSDRLKKLKK
jgi:hypothetical protein